MDIDSAENPEAYGVEADGGRESVYANALTTEEDTSQFSTEDDTRESTMEWLLGWDSGEDQRWEHSDVDRPPPVSAHQQVNPHVLTYPPQEADPVAPEGTPGSVLSAAPSHSALVDPSHDKSSGDSSSVLGRRTLRHIHTWLPLTELPSWVDRVPANVGTRARGKLSANQWHILCVVHLPIILIPLWSKKGETFKKMLENYLDLVTEVTIGGLLEMSQEAIDLYTTVSRQYV